MVLDFLSCQVLRTDRWTDRRTKRPKAICPFNFSEVGGIKKRITKFTEMSCITAAVRHRFKFLSKLSKSNRFISKRGLYNFFYCTTLQRVTRRRNQRIIRFMEVDTEYEEDDEDSGINNSVILAKQNRQRMCVHLLPFRFFIALFLILLIFVPLFFLF